MVETRPLFDMMLYVHDLDDYYYIRQSEDRVPDIDNEVALHCICMSKIKSVHQTVNGKHTVIYVEDEDRISVYYACEHFDEVHAAIEEYKRLRANWELKKNEIIGKL